MLFLLGLQIGMAHSHHYVDAGLHFLVLTCTRHASTCLVARELPTKLTEAPQVGHRRDMSDSHQVVATWRGGGMEVSCATMTRVPVHCFAITSSSPI